MYKLLNLALKLILKKKQKKKNCIFIKNIIIFISSAQVVRRKKIEYLGHIMKGNRHKILHFVNEINTKISTLEH